MKILLLIAVLAGVKVRFPKQIFAKLLNKTFFQSSGAEYYSESGANWDPIDAQLKLVQDGIINAQLRLLLSGPGILYKGIEGLTNFIYYLQSLRTIKIGTNRFNFGNDSDITGFLNKFAGNFVVLIPDESYSVTKFNS